MAYQASSARGKKRKILKSNFLINPPPFEWTEKQKHILDTMNSPETRCIIMNTLAGCGKTTLAVYSALHHLQNGYADKIIYIRTAVESAHSKLGYLKGSLEDKFGPYVEPLLEKLADFLNPEEIANLTKDEKIQSVPISFLRGHDFKNAIVIADEMQNAYLNEIITLATRISENSKLFVLADSEQCDLPANGQKEFMSFAHMFSGKEAEENKIYYFELKDEMDVKRSEFVRYVTKKYREYKLASK